MPLSEALNYWAQHRQPQPPAVTEATRSVQRFIDMFGDLTAGDITREAVVEYRNLLTHLPP